MPYEERKNNRAGKPIYEAARKRLDVLAKPPGALAELERLAAELCAAFNSLAPQTRPRSIVVFAADHGAVAAGVSQWPQAVSRAVVQTILAGKAGCNVLAQNADATLRVVDVGLAGPALAPHARLTQARVRDAGRDMSIEPALTLEDFTAALAIGREAARIEHASGAKLLIAGEVGIGNTTAASAITALLCDLPTEAVLGPGAGADASVLAAKRRVIETALQRARTLETRDAQIASLCGLEIAAMAGFYLEGAAFGTPLILDGAISGAAALIAQAVDPTVTDAMIAAHLSPEPAHRAALEKLGLSPFLDWGFRLGEGTGALALLPLLDMAASLMTEMATLDEALALMGGHV